MKDENRVIKFDDLELPVKDIRYYELCSVIGSDIFKHYEKLLKERENKVHDYEEFYKRLKKSGYINDSGGFDKIIDEIFPMPVRPENDDIPVYYLYLSTPHDVFEFWENEVGFDIFEKFIELRKTKKL